MAGRRGRRVRPLDAEPDVEIAVLTNVELDHHATFALAGGAARGVPRVPRGPARGGRSGIAPSCSQLRAGPSSSPTTRTSSRSAPAARAFDWRGQRGARWRCPARTTRSTPPRALEAARIAGAERGARDRGPGRLPRRRPALSAARAQRRRRAACTTTTPTTRPRSRRRSPAARTLAHRRLVAVFQPHLYSRTASLAREFGRALALADVVGGARRLPGARARRGSPGRERAADRRGDAPTPRAGRPVYWLPTLRRRRAGAARDCSARATCAS